MDVLAGEEPPLHLHVGTNTDTGEEEYVDFARLFDTSTYVLGRPGTGKSKFLEHLCRFIVEQGYGLVVLDGKGSLYDNLLPHLTHLDNHGHRISERTTLINPNDRAVSVGINYLEPVGDADPYTWSRLVMQALKKFFGEDDEYKPWLEEWMSASLVPLIKAGFTLIEVFDLLNIADPAFRDAVLTYVAAQGDERYRAKWDTLAPLRPFDQDAKLGAARTRADTFYFSDVLRPIFGQQSSTIDWRGVMDNGGIVLARLGNTPKLDEQSASLIGASLLHQFMTVAPQRPSGKRRPLFFVVDEFQRFVTSDFADGLERMREFRIPFVLAHQHRGQFREEEPKVMDAIDACCWHRVFFATSRRDADEMVGDVYGGEIHEGAKEIKREIRSRRWEPVLKWEEILSVGEHFTESFGSGSHYGELGGTSTMTLTGEEGFFGGGPTSTTNIVTQTGGGSSMSGSASGTSRTRTLAPVIHPKEFEETTSQTSYPIEEVRERFTSAMFRQNKRCAQWKIETSTPVPIYTPEVEDVYVSEAVEQRFVDKVNSRAARPTAEVLSEIRDRVPQFIEHVADKLQERPESTPTQSPKRKTSHRKNAAVDVEPADDGLAGFDDFMDAPADVE